MKKIEYPRYTRKQNARCKLSNKDIAEIRRLHSILGVPANILSEMYRVTVVTIRCWFLSDEERKEKNKNAYIKYGDRYGIATRKERAERCIKRKDKLMPGKRNEYYKFKRKVNRKNKSKL